MIENDLEEYAAKIAHIGSCLASIPHDKRMLGFGQGRAVLLSLLDEHKEGLTPGELSTYLNVGTGRIGNLLLDLEKIGLLARHSDPHDHRRTIVTLTEFGEKRVHMQKEKFVHVLGAIHNKMGKEKFDEFLNLYTEIAELMVDLGKEKENEYV